MNEEKGNNPTLRTIITIMLILAIIGLIACMFLKCEGKKDQSITAESILQNQKTKDQNRIKELERINKNIEGRTKVLHDSIIVHIHHYHTLYDTLYSDADSTCKKALFKINEKAVNIISEHEQVILKKDSTIANLNERIEKKNDQLSADSLMHNFDQQQLKEANKDMRKRGFKRFVQGVLVGAAAVEAVNVINKLKP